MNINRYGRKLDMEMRARKLDMEMRARKLDMEMPPESLEDFLTKAAWVSAPWCAATSSLPFSTCPSRPR
jgi:hypothetical protein